MKLPKPTPMVKICVRLSTTTLLQLESAIKFFDDVTTAEATYYYNKERKPKKKEKNGIC